MVRRFLPSSQLEQRRGIEVTEDLRYWLGSTDLAKARQLGKSGRTRR